MLAIEERNKRCPWPIERLCEQAERVSEERMTGTNCKGIREEPYFKIPVVIVIWPILHSLIFRQSNPEQFHKYC